MSHVPLPGDFGLVRTGGFGSALIRLGTRSPANHAFIYVGGGHIVEAEPDGARLAELHYDKVRWSQFDLTDRERALIVQSALDQVGLPYNWLDIACLVLSSLGWDMGWAQHRLNALNKRICSQLVAVAYKTAGIDVAPHLLPSQVTPADLLVDVDGL